MTKLNQKTETCEFCQELAGYAGSRFRRIYGETLVSRTVIESTTFVVWPTIGQLLPKSILILPRHHVERFADLGTAQLNEFLEIVERVWENSGEPDNYLLFEHGARACSGTGCGIYHCHVHFVPIPASLSASSLFPFAHHRHKSLLASWSFHATGDNYIVLRDTLGETASIDQEMMSSHNVGSQYLRRKLAEVFEIPRPWDWREYKSPENDLLDAYTELRFADVS